jgi:hypothetical protein
LRSVPTRDSPFPATTNHRSDLLKCVREEGPGGGEYSRNRPA